MVRHAATAEIDHAGRNAIAELVMGDPELARQIQEVRNNTPSLLGSLTFWTDIANLTHDDIDREKDSAKALPNEQSGENEQHVENSPAENRSEAEIADDLAQVAIARGHGHDTMSPALAREMNEADRAGEVHELEQLSFADRALMNFTGWDVDNRGEVMNVDPAELLPSPATNLAVERAGCETEIGC